MTKGGASARFSILTVFRPDEANCVPRVSGFAPKYRRDLRSERPFDVHREKGERGGSSQKAHGGLLEQEAGKSVNPAKKKKKKKERPGLVASKGGRDIRGRLYASNQNPS